MAIYWIQFFLVTHQRSGKVLNMVSSLLKEKLFGERVMVHLSQLVGTHGFLEDHPLDQLSRNIIVILTRCQFFWTRMELGMSNGWMNIFGPWMWQNTKNPCIAEPPQRFLRLTSKKEWMFYYQEYIFSRDGRSWWCICCWCLKQPPSLGPIHLELQSGRWLRPHAWLVVICPLGPLASSTDWISRVTSMHHARDMWTEMRMLWPLPHDNMLIDNGSA